MEPQSPPQESFKLAPASSTACDGKKPSEIASLVSLAPASSSQVRPAPVLLAPRTTPRHIQRTSTGSLGRPASAPAQATSLYPVSYLSVLPTHLLQSQSLSLGKPTTMAGSSSNNTTTSAVNHPSVAIPGGAMSSFSQQLEPTPPLPHNQSISPYMLVVPRVSSSSKNNNRSHKVSGTDSKSSGRSNSSCGSRSKPSNIPHEISSSTNNGSSNGELTHQNINDFMRLQTQMMGSWTAASSTSSDPLPSSSSRGPPLAFRPQPHQQRVTGTPAVLLQHPLYQQGQPPLYSGNGFHHSSRAVGETRALATPTMSSNDWSSNSSVRGGSPKNYHHPTTGNVPVFLQPQQQLHALPHHAATEPHPAHPHHNHQSQPQRNHHHHHHHYHQQQQQPLSTIASHLTNSKDIEEERKRLKRALNRQSAQRCRKRKRAMLDDLKETNDLFTTHAAILEGLCSTNVEFNYRTSLVTFAHGTSKVLGWEPRLLHDRSVYELLQPNSKSRVQRLLAQLMDDWETTTNEAGSSNQDSSAGGSGGGSGRESNDGVGSGGKGGGPLYLMTAALVPGRGETIDTNGGGGLGGKGVPGKKGVNVSRGCMASSSSSSSFSSGPSRPVSSSSSDGNSDSNGSERGDSKPISEDDGSCGSASGSGGSSPVNNVTPPRAPPPSNDGIDGNEEEECGREGGREGWRAGMGKLHATVTVSGLAGLRLGGNQEDILAAAAMAELAAGYRRDADEDEEEDEEEDETSSMDSRKGNVDEEDPPPLKGGGSSRTKAAVAAAAAMAEMALRPKSSSSSSNSNSGKSDASSGNKPSPNLIAVASSSTALSSYSSSHRLPRNETTPNHPSSTSNPKKQRLSSISGIGLGGKSTVFIPTAGGRTLTRDVWQLAQVPCALGGRQEGGEDKSDPSTSSLSGGQEGPTGSQTFTSREPGSSTNSNIAQFLPMGHPASNEFTYQISNVEFVTRAGGVVLGDINGVVTLDGQGVAETSLNVHGSEPECVWAIRFHSMGAEEREERKAGGKSNQKKLAGLGLEGIDRKNEGAAIAMTMLTHTSPSASSSASSSSSSSSSSASSSLGFIPSSHIAKKVKNRGKSTSDDNMSSSSHDRTGSSGSSGSGDGSVSSSDEPGTSEIPHGSAKMMVTTFRRRSSSSSSSSSREGGEGDDWEKSSEASMEVEVE